MMHLISNPEALRSPVDAGALDDAGNIRVLPAAFWQQFEQAEISAFCVKFGLYSIPTVELVEWLGQQIAGRKALEIGAGNGVMADALGILASDNHMQTWPKYRDIYKDVGQAPVRYWENVEVSDALVSIKRHKPKVVIAAWVTHKYNPREPWRKGNECGVDERQILKVSDYILVGNRTVHQFKPLLDVPHDEFEPDWLVSRALNGSPNFIAVWKKGAK